MDAHVPEVIQPVIQTFLERLDAQLPGLVTAFYLHGSIALDAFDELFSDIDFVAVISRPCSSQEFNTLKSIHQAVTQQYATWGLDGIYVTIDLAQPLQNAITTHAQYNEGVFSVGKHTRVNLVTWWTILNKGITMRGESPQTLPFSVTWDQIIPDMKHNLNTYWRGFTTDLAYIFWLFSDNGLQWAALGVLRQLYSFKTHDITSKVGAGEFALLHLPERWHKLIHEALYIRQHDPTRLFKSKFARTIEAYRFMRNAVRIGNTWADQLGTE